MTVLITGGAGYIGSHIALGFLDAGRSVVIVDNLSSGLARLVPARAAFVEMDIRDTQRLARVMAERGVTAVVHCAASTVVPESVERPLEYYANNVVGIVSLLQAMQQSGVDRMIFSSTAAVYATGDGTPMTEQSPVEPASPYGMTKLIAERIIRDFAATGKLRYVILRYFNVAGADPQGRAGQSTPKATHLIKLALEAACGKQATMTIFGTDWPTVDGTGVRDFIHVSDLAQVHLMAEQHLAGGGESDVFNCGYGHGYSVRQVLDRVEAISARPLDIREAARRPGDLGQVIADPSKLKARLGWLPKYDDLDAIVGSAFSWENAAN